MLDEQRYPIQTYLTKEEMIKLAVSGAVNRDLWEQLNDGISILEFNERDIERDCS